VDREGIVISPALKKPKKQTTAAAHNIIMSGFFLFGVQWCLMFVSISGVIGTYMHLCCLGTEVSSTVLVLSRPLRRTLGVLVDS